MDVTALRCGSVIVRTAVRVVEREGGSRNVVVRGCWFGAVDTPLDWFVVDIVVGLLVEVNW